MERPTSHQGWGRASRWPRLGCSATPGGRQPRRQRSGGRLGGDVRRRESRPRRSGRQQRQRQPDRWGPPAPLMHRLAECAACGPCPCMKQWRPFFRHSEAASLLKEKWSRRCDRSPCPPHRLLLDSCLDAPPAALLAPPSAQPDSPTALPSFPSRQPLCGTPTRPGSVASGRQAGYDFLSTIS